MDEKSEYTEGYDHGFDAGKRMATREITTTYNLMNRQVYSLGLGYLLTEFLREIIKGIRGKTVEQYHSDIDKDMAQIEEDEREEAEGPGI